MAPSPCRQRQRILLPISLEGVALAFAVAAAASSAVHPGGAAAAESAAPSRPPIAALLADIAGPASAPGRDAAAAAECQALTLAQMRRSVAHVARVGEYAELSVETRGGGGGTRADAANGSDAGSVSLSADAATGAAGDTGAVAPAVVLPRRPSVSDGAVARAAADGAVSISLIASSQWAQNLARSVKSLQTLRDTIVLTVVSLSLGGLLILLGQRTFGMLVVYFGAQSGFNMYMKVVLSRIVISEELRLLGLPAAFFLTAAQQVVTFFVSGALVLALVASPWRYKFNVLRGRREWRAVIMFSLCFAANHALNNYSMSLVAVSLNLVIRSCIPLMTVFLQAILRAVNVDGYCKTDDRTTLIEISLMLAGVCFAAMATISQAEGDPGAIHNAAVVGGNMTASMLAGSTDNFTNIALGLGALELDGQTSPQRVMLGTGVGVLSIFFAAANLLCAAELAGGCNVNPLDATVYTSIPGAICLLPCIFFFSHPVWPEAEAPAMTDWAVFLKVIQINSDVLYYGFTSGLLSVCYSFLQYWLVVNLSAPYTAFAGNFNKAICIGVCIVIGLESLPVGAWALTMVIAVLGNMAAFAGYGYLRWQATSAKAASAQAASAVLDEAGRGEKA